MTLDANAIAREHGHGVLRDILDVSVPLKPTAQSPFLLPSQRQRRTKFERTSTIKIMSTKYPPLRAIVPGYLYEGFSVLAGRQKLGKTWLGIDWAVAVATGGVAMGSIKCNEGAVLYIDMENGHRRIQGRINTLFPNERDRPDLSRLEWVTEAPQLDQGFIAELARWRASVSVPTLVIIDVLQRIKPVGSMARNSYENDYSAWAPLQQWSTENRVAVLGLHHTKKGGAEDPLEALSGSNGLSACADTTIVLDAGQPLSLDRKLVPGADAVCVAEGNMSKSANASAWATRRGRRTWHARKLFVREPGDLRIGHRPLGVDGPRREGEEP